MSSKAKSGEKPSGLTSRSSGDPTLFKPTHVDQVFGMLHREGQQPLSIEEMDAAVLAEARRRWLAGDY